MDSMSHCVANSMWIEPPLTPCACKAGAAASFSDPVGLDTLPGSIAVHADQLTPFKCPPPLEYLIGVHARRPGHFCHTGARLHRQLHNLSLLRNRSPPAGQTSRTRFVFLKHQAIFRPDTRLPPERNFAR